MKNCKNLLLTLLVTLCVSFGACKQSDTDVLSTIPADAGMIVRVDAGKVLESAGCEKDGATWKLGGKLEQLCSGLKSGDRAKLDDMFAILPAIDSENIFIYEYRSDIFATCVVNHPEQLSSALDKELGHPDNKNGFKVYDGYVAMRGDRLWIAGNLDKLIISLDSAKKESAANVAAVTKSMAHAEDAIAVVLKYGTLLKNNPYISTAGAFLNVLADKYVSYNIIFDKNKMIMNGALLDSDATAISIAGNASPIDDSFTQYIPANTITSIAVGKPSDELIDAWLDGMGSYMKEIFGPYIKAINGTISISVAPPAQFIDFLQLSEWTATITAQYDSDKAAEILKIAAGLENQGFTVTLLADQIKIGVPGGIGLMNPANFYIGYFNGTLIASTRPISAGQQNSLADFFDGYYSAGFLEIPADGDIARGFNLPFGFNSNIVCENEAFKSVCEFTGSDYRYLESIIFACTDNEFHRKAVEAFLNLAQQDDRK